MTTTDPVATERQALADLLQSAGWGVLCRAFESQVNAAEVLTDVYTLLGETAPGQNIETALRQLIANRAGALQVLNWPAQRLDALSRATVPDEAPRGAPLNHEATPRFQRRG